MHTSSPTHHPAATPAPASAPTATLGALLFLRRGVNSGVGAQGETVVDFFFAKDTEGLFPHGLRARWAGPLAQRFLQTHAGQLRPGRGLQVQLHHIHARGDELCARISAATLAPLPPSWAKHQADQPDVLDTEP